MQKWQYQPCSNLRPFHSLRWPRTITVGREPHSISNPAANYSYPPTSTSAQNTNLSSTLAIPQNTTLLRLYPDPFKTHIHIIKNGFRGMFFNPAIHVILGRPNWVSTTLICRSSATNHHLDSTLLLEEQQLTWTSHSAKGTTSLLAQTKQRALRLQQATIAFYKQRAVPESGTPG